MSFPGLASSQESAEWYPVLVLSQELEVRQCGFWAPWVTSTHPTPLTLSHYSGSCGSGSSSGSGEGSSEGSGEGRSFW